MSEAGTGNGPEQDAQFTQEFIDALDAVGTYNRRHTGIGQMVGGMLSFFKMEEGEEPQLAPAEEAEIDRDLTTLLQTERLAAMGVTLYDPSTLKVADVKEDEQPGHEQPARLMMLVTDGDRFKDTLSRLNPTPEQRAEVANGVDTLMWSAVRVIQETYPQPDPDQGDETGLQTLMEKVADEQLELFFEVSPILAEKGFADSKAYERLSEYAARQASGTLPEYREAEAQHLLEPQFGPDRWVVDMSPEELEKRWNQAFALLGRLQSGEEPSPFFTELFTKLRADFDAAKGWTDTVVPRDDNNPESTGPSEHYVKGVRGAMHKLNGHWEELFPLENAYYLREKADAEQ